MFTTFILSKQTKKTTYELNECHLGNKQQSQNTNGDSVTSFQMNRSKKRAIDWLLPLEENLM